VTGIVFRVVVRRDLDEQALEALKRVGATYISGHGGPGYASSSILVRADREEEARRKIESALGEHAFISEARAMPVFVYASVRPEARRAFELAAGEDERVGGVVEDESTGELEVYFELAPGDVDRAFNEARSLYARIADSAGVPVPHPLEMRMSGFDALMTQPSQARERLTHAYDLQEREEHALAVVVAQTACEVLIREVLPTLVQPHITDDVFPWARERIRQYALNDRQTQDLWARVAGSAIQDEDFWPAYKSHLDLRNRIVHRGESATADDAAASLSTAEALIDYVERTTGAAPPPEA
jgi:HEPN domain-containing protein